MSKKRREYDKGFKTSAVKLVLEAGNSILSVSRDLGVPESTLGKWVKAYKAEAESAFIGSGNLKVEDQLEREVKKRIRDLEEENEILKKAMRIFVK